MQRVRTMTARGFEAAPFAGLVFGLLVRVDLDLGVDDPGRELRERTDEEIVRRTRAQTPS